MVVRPLTLIRFVSAVRTLQVPVRIWGGIALVVLREELLIKLSSYFNFCIANVTNLLLVHVRHLRNLIGRHGFQCQDIR